MTVPLVTAVSPRWEVELAGVLARSHQATVARRCADVAELLGVAAAGLARVAVVSSDLRGLDRGVLDQLRSHDVAVLGVHPPGDEPGARALRRWGVAVVLPADSAHEELDEGLGTLVGGEHPTAPRPGDESGPGPAVREEHAAGAIGARGPGGGQPGEGRPVEAVDLAADGDVAGGTGVGASGGPDLHRDGRAGDPGPFAEPVLEGTGEEQDRGRVVVVWGPPGGSGRTTVAVNLAAELADPLRPAMLVDADTYASSVAQVLGMLDEVPGVVAAARVADQGTLDRSALAELAPEARPGLRVLTGLPRADRWPELRDVALADVLECSRQLAAWTVVDVAACLEEDEELSFDTRAPRRNGAALTALEAADAVVVVGAGDPVGLQRLVRGLEELATRSPAPPRTVVVNRARPGPVGRDHGRRIREALQRFAGLDAVHLVPEDQEALDLALLHGSTLEEVRPRSPARMALVDLAVLLGGQPRHLRHSGQPPKDRRGARLRRAG